MIQKDAAEVPQYQRQQIQLEEDKESDFWNADIFAIGRNGIAAGDLDLDGYGKIEAVLKDVAERRRLFRVGVI
jgi:hypothetical protein